MTNAPEITEKKDIVSVQVDNLDGTNPSPEAATKRYL